MSAISQTTRQPRIEGYPARNTTFEIAVGFLSALFVFGLFVDGWAHNHGLVDKSFFTPYHAIMYGTFLLLGLALVGMQFYNVSKGHAFAKALPYGYLTSLCGVLLFGFGGAADMLWHLAFGIEANLEALISPSHLILLIGYLLILGGLIQAAWVRPEEERTWATLWQTLVSWIGVLSVLLFLMQYVYFINDLDELVGRGQGAARVAYSVGAIGTARFLISSLLFTGVTLMMLRRWRLPFGALTFVYGVSATLMAWMLVRDGSMTTYRTMMLLAIAPAVLVGLVLDMLILWLKPSQARSWALYAIGGLVPMLLSLGYMATIHIYGVMFEGGGLWWRVHMWLGVPMLAMVFGVLMSVLLWPPKVPQEI